MGNYRFRLSDMIPNAWFYKLTDMSKTRKHKTTSPKKKPPTSSFPPQRTTHLSQARYSYYITTDHQQPNRDERFFYNSSTHPRASDTTFPEQPRRSSTKRSRRKAVYKPSPKKHVISSSVSSGHCSCHASTPESLDYFGSSSSERNSTETHDFHELIPSEFESDQLGASEFGSYSCRGSSPTSDTTIDKKKQGSTNKVHDRFDMISELELPPILTKPMKLVDHNKAIESTKFRKSTSSKLKETKGYQSLSVKIVKEEKSSSSRTQKDQKTTAPSFRNSSASPTGIRLRGNPPRLASKKLQQQPFGSRKSVSKNRGISDSFAVVKSSLDPQRDFKDSMREMIMENNINEAKDLEDLLACYLSLNSREYHDLIVKAFEQIWFDMASIKI